MVEVVNVPKDKVKASKVLIVDDDFKSIKLLESYLEKERFDILTARDGKQGLDIAGRTTPDLVLLDVMMASLDGYAVCQILKEHEATRYTPIIMITSLASRNDRIRGLQAGADDFLTKPVDRIELVTRVKSLLRVKELFDNLESAEHVIYTLAKALEERDPYSAGHSVRVSQLSRELADAVGMSRKDQKLLEKACLLHDVGKIGIDTILRKPGSLSKEEFEKVKEHPVKGERICKPLKFAVPILPLIRHHHEWWNGRGYPDGLMFDSTPLGARIMAIADAYDAMTSERPYRASLLPAKALDVLEDGAGKQWDPDLIRVFVSLLRKKQPGHLRKNYSPLW